MPHENVIDLVKTLSVGLCSCTYPMGRCNIGWDPDTGTTTCESDLGPKVECTRCKARRALEADSIEYVKVDTARYSVRL